jgi:hypothetical protein
MRKAFNFYRSYYDVSKELTKNERGEFLWALLQKQFEGIEPDFNELSKMSKFAYLSQKHSIDAQVLGFEGKTKIILNPNEGGTEGGSEGGKAQGKGKEKEKEKEEVKLLKKDVDKFLLWFNNTKLKYKNSVGKFKTLNPTDINNLLLLKKLNYTAEDFDIAFKEMCNSAWVNENNMCTPAHFLRNDNFTRYLNAQATQSNVKFKAAWQ